MNEQLDRRLPDGFTNPDTLTGLPKDTPILVAYSGGADSTALLHMLCRYAKQTGAPLYAAHVNHGIRGAEADRDEEFCRQHAAALGVPLFVHRADVPALAQKQGESIETTARQVRYAFFDELMRQREIPLLATAHNADDNLETMLYHLIRGSGLWGMAGIPITRRCPWGTLVRPILGMTREQILAYCDDNALTFVTDSTNLETDYTRNKLRARVIPALREINPSAAEHAAHLAEILRADALCLDSMCELFSEELRRGNGFEIEKLCGSPDAIATRALRALFAELTEGGSLEYSHVRALMELAQRGVPHASVTLPLGFEGVIEEGCLRLRRRLSKQDIAPYEVTLSEGKTLISQTECEIIMGNSQNTKNIYKKSILLSLDSATINGCITARSRKAGDRILLGGMHKSLKKLMCDKKIPPELRARLPVLCDGDGILAVPCIGIRDGARPTDPQGDGVLTLTILL